MLRRRSRLLIVVAIVAMLVALRYVASNRTVGIYYWTVDDRTLGIELNEGARDACSIARATETAEEIRVKAECREPFFFFLGAGNASATRYDFAVPLAEPLGNRVVLDGLGGSGIKCYPRCGAP